jgi:hypothetical protein
VTDEPGAARRWLIGPPGIARLTVTHCVHGAAETFFAVSMAGSIFFSVSPEAARPRVLLFLTLTLAPFLVMAPLFGPLVERLRGGLGVAITGTFIVRAGLALMLAGNLRTLLLFPLAFAFLVTAKSYTVARNALMPTLARGREDLVSVSSRLARSATMASSVAAVAATVLYTTLDGARVLQAASVVYVAGALVAGRLRGTPIEPRAAQAEVVRELEQGTVTDAIWAMTALRAAIGFTLFHVTFSLRAEEAPAWTIGALIAANGLGSFVGSVLAPIARRRMSEHRMITVALIAPAVMTTVAGLALDLVTLLAAVGVLGISGSIARRALDALFQRQAPHARRGSVYAWLETRFELAWVIAACLAVASQVATWVGVIALAGFLVVVAIVHARQQFRMRLLEPRPILSLPERLLDRAESLWEEQAYDEAIALARAAQTRDFPRSADAATAREAIEAARESLRPGRD